jgi:hypothetical protein
MFVFLIGNWISWKLGTIEASLTLNPKFVKKFQRPCGKGVAYNSHFSALTCSNHSHLFRSSFGSSFSMKPCSFVFQMFIPLPSDGLCCSFSLFLFYCFYIFLNTNVFIIRLSGVWNSPNARYIELLRSNVFSCFLGFKWHCTGSKQNWSKLTLNKEEKWSWHSSPGDLAKEHSFFAHF